jgi:hypothetical protein
MQEITRVGVDLAKHVIQVHAVDGSGKLRTSRALARDKFMAWCAQLPPGCMVAMEASSSAHHWARKLAVLGLEPGIIAAHLAAPWTSTSPFCAGIAPGTRPVNRALPSGSYPGPRPSLNKPVTRNAVCLIQSPQYANAHIQFRADARSTR